MTWDELIRRVFAKGVLQCSRCHGRMTIIAAVTDPAVVRKTLECVGLQAGPPPVAPAREQTPSGFEG